MTHVEKIVVSDGTVVSFIDVNSVSSPPISAVLQPQTIYRHIVCKHFNYGAAVTAVDYCGKIVFANERNRLVDNHMFIVYSCRNIDCGMVFSFVYCLLYRSKRLLVIVTFGIDYCETYRQIRMALGYQRVTRKNDESDY